MAAETLDTVCFRRAIGPKIELLVPNSRWRSPINRYRRWTKAISTFLTRTRHPAQ